MSKYKSATWPIHLQVSAFFPWQPIQHLRCCQWPSDRALGLSTFGPRTMMSDGSMTKSLVAIIVQSIYIDNMSQSYPIIISLISSNFSSFICTKEELDSLTVYYTGFPKMREPFSPCIGLYCFNNSILANLRAHFGVSQNKKLALGGPWRYGSKWG